MKKLYNQVKRDKWRENEYSMPIIARFGTGGGNMPIVLDALPFDTTQVTSDKNWSNPKWGDCCHPLASGAHPPAAVIKLDGQNDEDLLMEFSMQAIGTYAKADIALALKERDYKSATDLIIEEADAVQEGEPTVRTSVVRRLTPDECASLQGFPRNWCNIGEWTDSKGKVHKDADSPKYKACGNSIAVGYDNSRSGFWCWMARRICAQYERQITMGSLFDGIGGFPLAFQSCGAIPVWASEIEEFPIAVTKKHFPEEEQSEL